MSNQTLKSLFERMQDILHFADLMAEALDAQPEFDAGTTKEEAALIFAPYHDARRSLEAAILEMAGAVQQNERERLLAGYREIAAADNQQMRHGDLAREIAAQMLGPARQN